MKSNDLLIVINPTKFIIIIIIIVNNRTILSSKTIFQSESLQLANHLNEFLRFNAKKKIIALLGKDNCHLIPTKEKQILFLFFYFWQNCA